MGTIKKILLGGLAALGTALVIVLILAAMKPDQIHVERSIVIRAAAGDVLPYAADLRHFTTWIPWSELDPEQKIEFSEPSSGVGAWYTWRGNDEVGAGRMEVLKVTDDRVVHRLEFTEPFRSVAEATVSVKPASADAVEVTWSYDQDADFGSKVMAVFMDMDAMLGPDFAKGLARLKPLVEGDVSRRAAS